MLQHVSRILQHFTQMFLSCTFLLNVIVALKPKDFVFRRREQDADHRPKQPMADGTDSVVGEADENGFEEVGCDYLLKSRHSCLQEEGSTDFTKKRDFQLL